MRQQMFNYLAYLRSVTGDESWRPTDLWLINGRNQVARFQSNADQVTFTLDDQTIYVGPIKLDHPEHASANASPEQADSGS